MDISINIDILNIYFSIYTILLIYQGGNALQVQKINHISNLIYTHIMSTC